jgi:hypothetical protein
MASLGILLPVVHRLCHDPLTNYSSCSLQQSTRQLALIEIILHRVRALPLPRPKYLNHF